MGTRGTYKFIDNRNTVSLYKHWDNYPSGALGFIEKALEYSWELPRFEADEFAASFIAANKQKGGGDIRIENLTQYEEYNYEISLKNNELWIFCQQEDGQPIFSGSLDNFRLWVKELTKKAA